MQGPVEVHDLVDQLQAAVACYPRLQKHRVQLLPDLLAVLCGLRPLVLLDYVLTSPGELRGLVARCPALQLWPGCILELGRCCCVAHLRALLASTQTRLQQLHHHHQQNSQQQQQQQHLADLQKPSSTEGRGPTAAGGPPAPCFLMHTSLGWAPAAPPQLLAVQQQLGVLQQALEQLQAHSSGAQDQSCAAGRPSPEVEHQGPSLTVPPGQEPEVAAGACPAPGEVWQQAGPRRRGRGGRSRPSSDANSKACLASTALGSPSSSLNSSSVGGTMWPLLDLDALPGLPALPTLNGWLLEYPVVYLVHTLEEAAAASKALSSNKLHLHTVRAQLQSKVSLQLHREDAHHVLCAFSVPEAMQGDDALQVLVQQHMHAVQHRLSPGAGSCPGSRSAGAAGLCIAIVDPASCWLDIAMIKQWVGPQAVTL